MDDKTVKDILAQMKKKENASGFCAVLSDEEYCPHEISLSQFKPIPAGSSISSTLFVDAGNAEIIATPRMSLSIVRVHAQIYQNNRRTWMSTSEFYVLAGIHQSDCRLAFYTSIFPHSGEFPLGGVTIDFDYRDQRLKMNGSPSLSRVVDAVRRLSEISFAKIHSEKLARGSLIVLDGILAPNFPREEEILEQFYNACLEKDIAVCGFSKTSRMLTKSGYSVVECLEDMQPVGKWHVKISDATLPTHAPIYFARLHEKSSHIFRIDIKAGGEGIDTDNILASLCSNSRDPSFLGYPYGLIATDRFARVSNNELQYFKTIFKMKAGKEWQSARKQLSAIDAHSILDSM